MGQQRRHMQPVSPPGLTEFGGRAVTWGRWELAPWSVSIELHLGAWVCDGCDREVRPLIAFGKVHPTPGETVEAPVDRRARRSGRAYEVTEQVPAWPVWRLMAYRCPECWDLRVYSFGSSGDEFTEVLLPDDSTHGRLF